MPSASPSQPESWFPPGHATSHEGFHPEDFPGRVWGVFRERGGGSLGVSALLSLQAPLTFALGRGDAHGLWG